MSYKYVNKRKVKNKKTSDDYELYYDDLLEREVLSELKKLRRDEVMYEGEIMTLFEKACYDLNDYNLDAREELDKLYNKFYGGK